MSAFLTVCFSTDLTDEDQGFKAASVFEASIQKMPLVSLKEAVKSLEPLVSDIQRMVLIAKSNCENRSGALTLDESASTMLYTTEGNSHEESLYLILNKTLRSEDRNALKPCLL